MADHGIDIDHRPFLRMCCDGETEKVKMALKKGVNLKAADSDGKTALIWAADRGHVAVTELLLKQPEVDVNRATNGGRTPLIMASCSGHVAVVDLILQQPGVDVNAANHTGRTALMYAAYKEHVDVLLLLLNISGVDANAAYNGGWTALHFAAWNGHNDVLNLLYNHPGINLAATTKNNGQTVLHFLAKRKPDPDFLRILLNNPNIDPNQPDLQGNTPIMLLLQRSYDLQMYTESLQVFVDNDRVDLELKDQEGVDLEDMARYLGDNNE